MYGVRLALSITDEFGRIMACLKMHACAIDLPNRIDKLEARDDELRVSSCVDYWDR